MPDRTLVYEIKVLGTLAEHLAYYRLRHEVYSTIGYRVRVDGPALDIDEFDRYAIPIGAVDLASGAMVGTIRLVTRERQPFHERAIRTLLEQWPDPRIAVRAWRPRAFPLPSIVSDEVLRRLEAFNIEQLALMELSRSIVRPDHRGFGLLRGLMEFGTAEAARHGHCVIVGSATPEHVPMYGKFGYAPLPGTGLVRFDSVGQLGHVLAGRTDRLTPRTQARVDELVRAARSGEATRRLDISGAATAVHRFARWRANRTAIPEGEAVVEVQDLLDAFTVEATSMDASLRRHPLLAPIFGADSGDVAADEIRRAYLLLLKRHVDYVQYSVPALRAAGEALRSGDAEDRRWSEFLLGYAVDETDERAAHGHEEWIRQDMRALGAPPDLLDAPTHPVAVHYGHYFVRDAAAHPYAILGAKGALEHLAITSCADLERGLLASAVPNIENAVMFVHTHGILDIAHVHEGDDNLKRLEDPGKRLQVLDGAFFTGGVYRTLVHQLDRSH